MGPARKVYDGFARTLHGGNTALMLAARAGDVTVIKLLLTAGLKLEIKRRTLDCSHLLSGAVIDAVNNEGETVRGLAMGMEVTGPLAL